MGSTTATEVYPSSAGRLASDRSRTAGDAVFASRAGLRDAKRVQKSNACPPWRGKLYWYGMVSDPLVETDAAGNNPVEYIFFKGKRIARRDSAGAVSYYFADHLGTSRIVTNATGGVQDDADFYPFGKERPVVSASGNTYKFTGKEHDSESGLDEFGARYYSSALGRFVSADWSASPTPVPYARFREPQSLNLYSYVKANPVNLVDVDGHSWFRNTFPRKRPRKHPSPAPQNPPDKPKEPEHPKSPSLLDLWRAFWRSDNPELRMALLWQMLGVKPASVPFAPAQNNLGPPIGIPIPMNVLKLLEILDTLGSAPPGYTGGDEFANDGRGGGEILPGLDAQGKPITYREWDVNPTPSVGSRDAERIVTGSDGSAWYTDNHYVKFRKIR